MSQLRDGRTLGVVEFGPRSGNVIFYFHGYPGSRFEGRFLSEPAERFGIRLIGVDRPGMGLSNFKARRHVLDWPNDVSELADILEIDQFSVVGFSAGGPYAIACAYKIPARVIACGVVAGAGTVGHFLSLLSRCLPWLLCPIMAHFFQNDERASKMLRRFARRWPKADRKSLDLPRVSDTFVASLVESFRQGSRGPAYEGTLLGGAWAFRLEDVKGPRMHVWHGELDQQVPIARGRAIAHRLRRCKATYYPDEAHISLIVNHRDEIVQALVN